jgi:hypothetical protein
VAIRADTRGRPLAREELLAMATKTRRMLRKLGDIRESSVTFANVFPVCSGDLVARIALQLLIRDVSGM